MKSVAVLAAVCCLLGAAGWITAAHAAGPLITPGAELVEVYAAPRFFEGPTWHPLTERLYFSSLTGGGQLHRLTPPDTVDLWMDGTQGINGTFLSRDHRLLCAQGEARKIISYRVGPEGPEDPVTLAENPSWHMPNDLCQTPSGDAYFTTPDFTSHTSSLVYHLSRGGVVTPVVTDMPLCNGVIASLDGQTLYASDSSMKWWRRYPILPDGSVGTGSVFFNPDVVNTSDPDGMTIDEFGNLYLNGRGGLWIVSPEGEQLDMVPVPEFNSNATFGGVDGKTLYITCNQKVYSLSMEVRGGLWRNVPPDNEPPQVDAGADQTVTSRTYLARLDGTVTDDGVPKPPGAVTTTWSRLSGPGQVAFDNASQVDTTATFSQIGVYVLELLAFDGIRPARDTVTITDVAAGDFDGDGDVDTEDGDRFETCMTGANLGPPPAGCGLVDIDEDSDVDMTDFGLFQRCLSGPGATPDPSCAG